jgi:quinol monooxygenase YgiN
LSQRRRPQNHRKGVLAIPTRKQFGSGKARPGCELQRLQFKSSEGIRLARELWEILRRKKACTLNRIYRSPDDDARWLVYSEWESLAELAGARRELARSSLNRRLHSLLVSSSERAYEPFGPVQSVHGVNFASAPAAMLVRLSGELENPEEVLSFVAEQPGYISHILMHEVGSAAAPACFAHFDTADNARHCARQIEEHAALRELNPSVDLFLT